MLHQVLRFFQPWKSWTSGFYWYEHVKAEISIKTFLKEHYVTAWDSCYLFIKYKKNSEQEIEHDIDSAIKWSLYTFDIHEIYSTFDEYCNL